MKTLNCPTCKGKPTTMTAPLYIVGCFNCSNGQLGHNITSAKQAWNAFVEKSTKSKKKVVKK